MRRLSLSPRGSYCLSVPIATPRFATRRRMGTARRHQGAYTIIRSRDWIVAEKPDSLSTADSASP